MFIGIAFFYTRVGTIQRAIAINGGWKRLVWLENVFFNVGGMVDIMLRQYCLVVLFLFFYGRPKAA